MNISKHKFKHSFSIYVPILDNQKQNLDEAKKEICQYLGKKFDGFTQTVCSGVWRAPESGTIFEDKCNIFTVATDFSNPHFYVNQLLKICFIKTDQSAIFYILDGVSYLAKRG